MTATVVVSHIGNNELQRYSQQRCTMVGLMSAIIIHFSLIAVYILVSFLQNDGETNLINSRWIRLIHLPPPPIQEVDVRTVAGYAPPAIHTAQGIPVPDPEVSNELKPFARQDELGLPSSGPQGGGTGNGNGGIESTNLPGLMTERIESIEPDTFKSIEVYPIPVKAVLPDYPPAAKLAGIEGTVWVRCYVDKTGRVRKATILKSDSEIFNDAALVAAEQFLFTPAIMNAGAVNVWVSIPFRFTLGR